MRLIASVGTGDYQMVEYSLGEKHLRTGFVTEALAALLPVSEICLLFTPRAREKHGATLPAALAKHGVAVTSVGVDEKEIWGVFGQIAELAGDEPTAIDITHGFRSMPVVATLAASYFQAIGQLQLAGLYYGAYEARTGDRVPIWDLSPMSELTGWGLAVRAWQDHHDAGALRGLIRQATKAARLLGERATLNPLGDGLDDFGQSLRLARHDVRGPAATLQTLLKAKAQEVAQYAPPLAPLLEQAATPLAALQSPGLTGDLALVQLQRDGGHLLAATLLLRETLITWWQYQQDLPTRDAAENALGRLAAKRDGLQPGDLAGKLHELRNDLAHCGWRDNPADFASAQRRFDDILHQFKQLSSPRTVTA